MLTAFAIGGTRVQQKCSPSEEVRYERIMEVWQKIRRNTLDVFL